MLALTHAAIDALHGTVDTARVVNAIYDITSGIGCVGLAIISVSASGRELAPSAWRGISTEALWAICADEAIAEVARSGESFVAGDPAGHAPPHPSSLVACVALPLEGRVTDVAALFGMRADKSALLPMDRVLLGVLEQHAAPALYASRCYARDRPTRPPPPRAN
jgi:hypothetical protein